MDQIRNLVDVSSFLFFEATGDSELDSVDPNVSITTFSQHDDDAESCSYDSSDFHTAHDEVINDSCCHHFQACIIDDNVEEGDEAHSHIRDEKKSSVSVDSSHEELPSEMEKNRLFWETCLAS